MNCERFDHLLDANGPGDLPAEALAHANACVRCAHALAAARSIETLLVTASAMPAPPGFTDRVLARIQIAPAALPARAFPRVSAPFDPLPAWIRLVAEPATAGALVVAALVMWQAPRLLQIGRMIAATIAVRAADTGATIDPALWPAALRAATGNDAVQLALVVTGCSLAPLVAFSLYRLSERMVAGGRRPR